MTERYCRWCSKVYRPKKAVGRDGFCSMLCRVQLYRARKKLEKFAHLGKRNKLISVPEAVRKSKKHKKRKLPGESSMISKKRYTKRRSKKKK